MSTPSLKIQYTITVNQAAAVVSGVCEKLDLIDLAVLGLMWNYRNASFSSKKNEGGFLWFSIHWKTIVQQLPIIKIKSRQGILKRLNNLKEAGLLLPHDQNGTGGKAWFRFHERTDELFFIDAEKIREYLKPDNERVQEEQQPFTGGVNERVPLFEKPVHNGVHYNNTLFNNDPLNNTSKQNGDFSSFNKPLKPTEKTEARKLRDKERIELGVKCVRALNDIAGRKFNVEINGRGGENIKGALKLLKNGFTFEEIEEMIIFKVWEWKDQPEMAKHLNPTTLFKRHGARYIQEAIEAKENPTFLAILKAAKENQQKGKKIQFGSLTQNKLADLKNW